MISKDKKIKRYEKFINQMMYFVIEQWSSFLSPLSITRRLLQMGLIYSDFDALGLGEYKRYIKELKDKERK